MADDLIGRTLGRYQITGLVGRGGMATVYKATHPGLQQTVAIKVLHKHIATDPDLLRRFRQEAQAVANLRHPNIVRVVDFDYVDEQYFMVMEYVDGPTLTAHLERLKAAGRRMSPAETVRLFEALCSAVDYAHGQGMIHRDIKPANVLLTARGEPILTDYGIAKIIGVSQHTATGTVMGSAYYMSPEQAQGATVDSRSDLYSLGVILFEVLTGQVPYDGETLASILIKQISAPIPAVRLYNAELSPKLDAVVLKALAKDPDDRFQSGRELATALREALEPGSAAADEAEATRLERPGAGARPGESTRVEMPPPGPPSAAPEALRARTLTSDVYISYAAGDRATADAVCAALENRQFKCWVAPRDVLPGQSFAQALARAIHAARVFVLVFSSATNASSQVERELDMAVAAGVPILPLRIEAVRPRESIEYYLAGQHWLEASTPPLQSHLERLIEAVTLLLEAAPPLTPPVAPEAAPAVAESVPPGLAEEEAATAAAAETAYEVVPPPVPQAQPELVTTVPEPQPPVPEAEQPAAPEPVAEVPLAEALAPEPVLPIEPEALAPQPPAETAPPAEPEAPPVPEGAAPVTGSAPSVEVAAALAEAEAGVAAFALEPAEVPGPGPEAETPGEPAAPTTVEEPAVCAFPEPVVLPEPVAPAAVTPPVVPLPEKPAAAETTYEREAPAAAETTYEREEISAPAPAAGPQPWLPPAVAVGPEPVLPPAPAAGPEPAPSPPPPIVPPRRVTAERTAGTGSAVPSAEAPERPQGGPGARALIAAAAVGVAWVAILLVVALFVR